MFTVPGGVRVRLGSRTRAHGAWYRIPRERLGCLASSASELSGLARACRCTCSCRCHTDPGERACPRLSACFVADPCAQEHTVPKAKGLKALGLTQAQVSKSVAEKIVAFVADVSAT